jgi:hypothetical protein
MRNMFEIASRVDDHKYVSVELLIIVCARLTCDIHVIKRCSIYIHVCT